MNDPLPPQSIAMEQAALGCMIIEPDTVSIIDAIISERDYYRSCHGTIHRAIVTLHRAGDPIDLLTVQQALQTAGEFERIGQAPYLIELTDAVPTTVNAEHYAAVVKEMAVRRAYIRAAAQVQYAAYDCETPLEEVGGLAAETTKADTRNSDRTSAMGDLMRVVIERSRHRAEALGRGEVLSGVTSGCPEIDAITDGWQPAELSILGARPSVGKTALSLQWALEAARAGQRVLYASAEMSPGAIATRAGAYLSEVDSRSIVTGRTTGREWNRVLNAAKMAEELPITVINAAGMRPAELENIVRRSGRVDLVVVDYLQQLAPDAGSTGNRTEEVSSISRALKTMAVRNNVHVMAAAQLHRGIEGRADSTPHLSDIRESGSIEADADVVMFIWRSNVVVQGGIIVNFSVAKNRNGSCSRGAFVVEPWCGRFTWDPSQHDC